MSPVLRSSQLAVDACARVLGRAGRAGRAGAPPALASSVVPELAPVVDPTVALRAEIERLRVEQEDALAQAEQALAETRRAAYEEGRAAGLAEAQRADAERTQAVTESARAALAALDERLAGLEELANAIALTAVERVLGARESRAEVVSALVREQLETLREAMPVRVAVAAVDFPDASVLDDVVRPPIRIELDPALKTGDCRIHIGLGIVDADLGHQLDVLRDLLRGHGDAG